MCHLCCLCCRKVFCLDCLTNKSQIPKVSKLKIVPVLLKTTNDVIKKKKSQNKYEISEQTHLMQLNKLKNQTDNTNKTISDDLLSTKGKIANLFTARSTWEKRLTLEKPKNKENANTNKEADQSVLRMSPENTLQGLSRRMPEIMIVLDQSKLDMHFTNEELIR